MTSNNSAQTQVDSAPIDRVPLLDIQRENAPLQAELQQAIVDVLESGWFVFGPNVSALEEAVAELCQVKHAIGCASGSDALLLALLALDVGPGDEVLLPSFTFFATAGAPWRLGAKPVFVDIDPDSFNLRPECVEAAISPKTKAILPVHLFGQCAEMDALNKLAKEHGLAIIEDAAQAIGAKHHGRPAGAMSDIGCFSFYPTKNLGGCGDGGMLTTSDDALAERLRRLRNHGMQPRYYHDEVGVNSRLDAMQAAALRVKLPCLREWSAQRAENAQRYTQLFTQAGIDAQLALPEAADDSVHVWNQYTIRVPDGRRDALREHLQARNVSSEIYYPVPLHQQKCFVGLHAGDNPLIETEKAAAEVLSLPIFPQLTPSEQAYVVEAVASFYAEKVKTAA